ncbi:MAG TPA: HNH endonuclease [Gemmatimonadales bacterium]|nr:HNH endonuclease [Gemmatimonadales bacterium]
MDADLAFRLAVFDHVARLRDANGGVIPAAELNRGIRYEDERVPIWNQQKGIFRPARFRDPGAALTIVTAYDGPYDDQADADATRFLYRYRGTDPSQSDNVAVRRAFQQKRPLLYLIAVRPGLYEAVFPCYVVEDRPAELTFALMAEAAADLARVRTQDPGVLEARRAYQTVAVKRRLHQQQFRFLVMGAYGDQCAMCRLRHPPLLDAAHILPDSDPRGRPTIPNGLSLCKIHHGAYDIGILGVDPDYRVHVRDDVLDEHDGPMLRHGLQEMHGSSIQLPRRVEHRPNREYLAERFARFEAA